MSFQLIEFTKNWNTEFEATFKELHHNGQTGSSLLCSIKLVETRESWEKNGFLIEFAWFIAKLYSYTVLFPDKEVKNSLRKLGFTKYELRWYTSIAKTVKTFSVVSNKGRFLFHPGITIQLIHHYYSAKIIDTVLKFYGFTGPVYRRDTNLAEVAIHKFLLRSKSNKTGRLSDYDLELHQMLAEARNKEPDLLQDLNQLKKHAQGKVEKIHIGELFRFIMVNPEFPKNETGLNEKYRSFYPLAQLIFKDENLYSESEFKRGNDYKDYYDGDFGKYKVERLKRILKK